MHSDIDHQFDPYEHFREFYSNTLIKSVAGNERWTISDNNKMPIDMFILEHKNRVAGAKFTDGLSLVTLDKLLQLVPNAANNAYYLDSLIDGFCVLDIEPKCPDDIKSKLLELPYIYGETSMSGNGYHLLFRLPDCISEYPAAQKKLVLKEKHGYYEILLNHWVTFTRNTIQAAKSDADQDGFIKIFRDLAREQIEYAKTGEFEVSQEAPDNIPFKDTIVAALLHLKFNKTLDDYNGDKSRYEFGYTGSIVNRLNHILKNCYTIRTSGHEYTNNEKAWLVYEAAQELIPKRDKHDTVRNNMPWLLYLAKSCIEKSTTADNDK
jgi:hypothetical protein